MNDKTLQAALSRKALNSGAKFALVADCVKPDATGPYCF